jgi:hypothetical protein
MQLDAVYKAISIFNLLVKLFLFGKYLSKLYKKHVCDELKWGKNLFI